MHLSTNVALVVVHSKAVVLLLLICCVMYLLLLVEVLCWSLFWYALRYVLTSFAIILTRKRELVAFIVFRMSFCCKWSVALAHSTLG